MHVIKIHFLVRVIEIHLPMCDRDTKLSNRDTLSNMTERGNKSSDRDSITLASIRDTHIDQWLSIDLRSPVIEIHIIM